MRMSRVTDTDHRDLRPCNSCLTPTRKRCQRERHRDHDIPLCRHCECAWVVEHQRYRHVIVAAGTPWIRWYLARWPQGLPPPRAKRYGRAHEDVTALLDAILENGTMYFSPIWDRDDALLAIAYRALEIHARDARVIDAWNEFVKRENEKRAKRRLRGWRNRYYTRAIRPLRGD